MTFFLKLINSQYLRDYRHKYFECRELDAWKQACPDLIREGIRIISYLDSNKLNREEVEKEMEELTVRFNNAVTAQDKIDTTLKLQRARAKVQAARFVANNP